MAAISGVLRFDGAPRAGEYLRQVSARMQHRSPDGIGVWDGGAIALAFGALHATPQALFDQQPVALADGAVLVMDGRIDNRPALADELSIDRTTLAKTGDAALFAQAWLRWREELWRHVLGDYALAIWEPARQRLSLVRDRIGVRPLYWARTPSMLAFASEAEGLTGVGDIPAEPNLDRVASNLVPIFDDGDRGATLYRDIRRVMPGEILEADVRERVTLRRYWSFAPLEPLRLASHAAYIEAFREVFDDAVRVRLVSPTTPALMLSGGIDSASIHASALRQNLALRRVSVVANQDGAEEERTNIETLLAQVPDPLRLPIPGLEGVVDLPALVREVFEHAHPVRNSIILPMLVNQAAALQGSRVVLDGIDGDLVMSTPDNYIGRMALAGHPFAAWREARAAAKSHTYLKHLSASRIFAWGVASRLEPRWLAHWRYRLSDLRAGAKPFLGLLHPDLVASLRLRERTLEQRIHLRSDPSLRDWTGYRHWVWANPGLMRGMEGFDLAAARFGIEARHPWCDQRVIDFFLRVPMDVVVRGGWTKHVARAAYAPVLGTVAWHSGKQHVGPQVTRSLLSLGTDHVESAIRLACDDSRCNFDFGAITVMGQAWGGGKQGLTVHRRLLEAVTFIRWIDALAVLSADTISNKNIVSDTGRTNILLSRT